MSLNEKRPAEGEPDSGRSHYDENASHPSIEASRDTAHVVALYESLGWCPLPLPEGLKYPPPEDVTGNKPYPTPAELADMWADADDNANTALRMPRFRIDGEAFEVLGIDVDSYDSKTGDETLAALVADLGELPPTFFSTSRDPDNPSGIRFYLVPAGLKWKGKPGHDIEIVQRTHRYAVAWPSVVEGRTYQWYDAEGRECDVPDVADLPRLPHAWRDYLRKGTADPVRADVVEIDDLGEALGWLSREVPGYDEAMSGQMSRQMDMNKLTDEMSSGAHDAMINRVHEAVQLAAEGHHGLKFALNRIRKAFYAEVLIGDDDDDARRDATSAVLEWNRSVCGEVSKLRADVAGNLIRISPIGGYAATDGEIDLAVFREKVLGRIAAVIRTVDATEFEDSDQGRAELFRACVGEAVRPIVGGEWAYWDDASGRLLRIDKSETYGRAWNPAVKASLLETAKRYEYEALQWSEGTTEREEAESAAKGFYKRNVDAGNKRNIDPSLALAHSGSLYKLHPEVFDAERLTIGLPDAVLDLRTVDENTGATLRKGTTDDHILMSAAVSYDPDATSPLWDAYLAQFIPDEELRRYVRKVLGYAALIGGNPERVMVWLKGGTSTGKSTIIEAIQACLGDYAATFEINGLFRQKRDGGPNPDVLSALMRRVVFASEVGHRNTLHVDVIKRLTGKDRISARALYSNVMIEQVPMFTPVIATNSAPTIEGADAAFARRLIVLPFDHAVPVGAPKAQVVDLRDDPEALRALFAWLVEGAVDYLREGLYNDTPAVCIERRGEFLASVDDFRGWVDSVFVVDEDARRTARTDDRIGPREALAKFRHARGFDKLPKSLREMTDTEFGNRMNDLFGKAVSAKNAKRKSRSVYTTPIVLRDNRDRR